MIRWNKPKEFHFFATRDDLHLVFTSIEKNQPLDYILVGSFESDQIIRYDSIYEIPNLGTAKYGDEVQEATYIIVPRGVRCVVREVPQRRGGVRYIVDALDNPEAVDFRPGGKFKEEALISGGVSIYSSHETAQKLYESIYKVIAARFTSVQTFSLGPEALSLFKAGLRFTQNVKSPMTLSR